MKKVDDSRVDFDIRNTGMNNRGEYVRIPTKEHIPEKEVVDHPDHYNQGIEVIDYIDSWDFNFTIGNIIKYVSRHRHKAKPLEDLKKAKWYLDRLIKKYED